MFKVKKYERSTERVLNSSYVEPLNVEQSE